MMLPRRRARLLAVGTLFLGLSACEFNPTDPQRAEKAKLQAARDLWARQGILDYAYTVQRICYCAEDAAGPVEVEVRGGNALSARYASSGEPADPRFFNSLSTVEGLFDTIARALIADPDRVSVSYDPQLGYPREAEFDFDRRTRDDEEGFRVESFRRLP